MDTERLRMRLNIMRMNDFKTNIVMKSKRYEPFIAKVKEIIVNEEDLRVIFERCIETVFPDDRKGNQEEEYTTLIKNIKSVDRYWETPKK